jgi:hypothetical protein
MDFVAKVTEINDTASREWALRIAGQHAGGLGELSPSLAIGRNRHASPICMYERFREIWAVTCVKPIIQTQIPHVQTLSLSVCRQPGTLQYTPLVC